MDASQNDPHRGQPVLAAGAPLELAKAAMIMLHGRGANAADIIGLAAGASMRPELAYLAPDAAGRVWYPNPFMTRRGGNEPYLSSALGVIARLIADRRAPPASRRSGCAILGFSQGACLALEFAARNPRRYGGIVGAFRRTDRRQDRAGRLFRLARRHAGVHRLQRRRSVHPARARPGVGGGHARAWRRRDRAHLSGRRATRSSADEVEQIRRIVDKMLARDMCLTAFDVA